MEGFHDYSNIAEKIRSDPERAARAARARDEAIGEMVAHTLAELRQMRKVTQVELARALATGQPNVSRIEHQDRLELETVQNYVEALGGRLELAAVFDGERVPLAIP